MNADRILLRYGRSTPNADLQSLRASALYRSQVGMTRDLLKQLEAKAELWDVGMRGDESLLERNEFTKQYIDEYIKDYEYAQQNGIDISEMPRAIKDVDGNYMTPQELLSGQQSDGFLTQQNYNLRFDLPINKTIDALPPTTITFTDPNGKPDDLTIEEFKLQKVIDPSNGNPIYTNESSYLIEFGNNDQVSLLRVPVRKSEYIENYQQELSNRSYQSWGPDSRRAYANQNLNLAQSDLILPSSRDEVSQQGLRMFNGNNTLPLTFGLTPSYDENGKLILQGQQLNLDNLKKSLDALRAVEFNVAGGGYNLLGQFLNALYTGLGTLPTKVKYLSNAIGNTTVEPFVNLINEGVWTPNLDQSDVELQNILSRDRTGANMNILRSQYDSTGEFETIEGLLGFLGQTASSLLEFGVLGRALGLTARGILGAGGGIGKAAGRATDALIGRLPGVIPLVGKLATYADDAAILALASLRVDLALQSSKFTSRMLDTAREVFFTPQGLGMFGLGMILNTSEGYRNALAAGLDYDALSKIGIAYGTVAALIETGLGNQTERILVGMDSSNEVFSKILRAYKNDPGALTSIQTLSRIAKSSLSNPRVLLGMMAQEAGEEVMQRLTEEGVRLLWNLFSPEDRLKLEMSEDLFTELYTSAIGGLIGLGMAYGAGGYRNYKQWKETGYKYISDNVLRGNTDQMLQSILKKRVDGEIDDQTANKLYTDIMTMEELYKRHLSAWREVLEHRSTTPTEQVDISSQLLTRLNNVNENINYLNNREQGPGPIRYSDYQLALDIVTNLLGNPMHWGGDSSTLIASSEFLTKDLIDLYKSDESPKYLKDLIGIVINKRDLASKILPKVGKYNENRSENFVKLDQLTDRILPVYANTLYVNDLINKLSYEVSNYIALDLDIHDTLYETHSIDSTHLMNYIQNLLNDETLAQRIADDPGQVDNYINWILAQTSELVPSISEGADPNNINVVRDILEQSKPRIVELAKLQVLNNQDLLDINSYIEGEFKSEETTTNLQESLIPNTSFSQVNEDRELTPSDIPNDNPIVEIDVRGATYRVERGTPENGRVHWTIRDPDGTLIVSSSNLEDYNEEVNNLLNHYATEYENRHLQQQSVVEEPQQLNLIIESESEVLNEVVLPEESYTEEQQSITDTLPTEELAEETAPEVQLQELTVEQPVAEPLLEEATEIAQLPSVVTFYANGFYYGIEQIPTPEGLNKEWLITRDSMTSVELESLPQATVNDIIEFIQDGGALEVLQQQPLSENIEQPIEDNKPTQNDNLEVSDIESKEDSEVIDLFVNDNVEIDESPLTDALLAQELVVDELVTEDEVLDQGETDVTEETQEQPEVPDENTDEYVEQPTIDNSILPMSDLLPSKKIQPTLKLGWSMNMELSDVLLATLTRLSDISYKDNEFGGGTMRVGLYRNVLVNQFASLRLSEQFMNNLRNNTLSESEIETLDDVIRSLPISYHLDSEQDLYTWVLPINDRSTDGEYMVRKSIVLNLLMSEDGSYIVDNKTVARRLGDWNFESRGLENYYKNLSNQNVPVHSYQNLDGTYGIMFQGQPISYRFAYVNHNNQITSGGVNYGITDAPQGSTFMLFTDGQNLSTTNKLLLRSESMSENLANWIIDRIEEILSSRKSLVTNANNSEMEIVLSSLIEYGFSSFNPKEKDTWRSLLFVKRNDGSIHFGEAGVKGLLDGIIRSKGRRLSEDERLLLLDFIINNKAISVNRRSIDSKFRLPLIESDLINAQKGETIESFLLRNDLFYTNLRESSRLFYNPVLEFTQGESIVNRNQNGEITDEIVIPEMVNELPDRYTLPMDRLQDEDVLYLVKLGLFYEDWEALNPKERYTIFHPELLEQQLSLETTLNENTESYELTSQDRNAILILDEDLLSENGLNYIRSRNLRFKELGAPIIDGDTGSFLLFYAPEGSGNYTSFDTMREAELWINSKYDELILNLLKSKLNENLLPSYDSMSQDELYHLWLDTNDQNVKQEIIQYIQLRLTQTRNTPNAPDLNIIDSRINDIDFSINTDGFISRSIMSHKQELDEVERMLGPEARDRIKIVNTAIKPDLNDSVIAVENTKDGQEATIYDPISVLNDADSPMYANGRWTQFGIEVFVDLLPGTTFHEMFHEVERYYLNDRQLLRLYNLVRKSNKLYKNYTDRQLSEILLEQFRQRVLDKEFQTVVNKSDGIVTRAFKSIMRFARHYIFNFVPSVNIDNVFTLIYEGRYRNNRRIALNESRLLFSINSNSTINVYSGTNENLELSNFANRPFTYKGVRYRNVESAFQALKLDYLSDSRPKTEFSGTSGSNARALGRRIEGLNSSLWDQESSRIMEDIMYESFIQNENAKQLLLNTGNLTITHNQDRTKWKTEFPRILMSVRSRIREGLTQSNIDFTEVKAKPMFNYNGVNFRYLKSLLDVYNISNQLAKYIIFKDNVNPKMSSLFLHIVELMKELMDNQQFERYLILNEVLNNFNTIFQPEVIRLLKVSYNKLVDQINNDVAIELNDMVDGILDLSDDNLIEFRKVYGIDSNRTLAWNYTPENIKLKYLYLRQSSRYDSRTGLPILFSQNKAQSKLYYNLYDSQSVSDMLKRIRNLATIESSKKFGRINMWSDLLVNLTSSSNDELVLFYNHIRAHKNEYVSIDISNLLQPSQLVNSIQYATLIRNAYRRFLKSKLLKTKGQYVNALTKMNEISASFRSENYEGLLKGLTELLSLFEINGISQTQIEYLLESQDGRTPMQRLYNMIYRDENYKIFSSVSQVLPSLFTNTGDLYGTYRLRNGKVLSVNDYGGLFPFIKKITLSGIDIAGVDLDSMVVGLENNSYLKFVKPSWLTELFTKHLKDPNFVESLRAVPYNKNSRWLSHVLDGYDLNLLTFLSYKDSKDKNGVLWSDMSPEQHWLYLMLSNLTGVIPFPNFGDRSQSYLLSGIEPFDINIQGDTDLQGNPVYRLDDDTVLMFNDYLNDELDQYDKLRQDVVSLLQGLLGSTSEDFNSLVKKYNEQSTEFQNLNPPVGLTEYYHYTTRQTPEGLRYEIASGRLNAFKLLYFDFMGTPQSVRLMLLPDRMTRIRLKLTESLNRSMQQAVKDGVLAGRARGEVSTDILGMTLNDELIITTQNSKIPDYILNNLTRHRGRWAKTLQTLVNTEMNSIIASIEVEKVIVGYGGFYKTLDDKNARYQAVTSVGVPLQFTGRKQLTFLNANDLYESVDDFVLEIRPDFIQYYKENITRLLSINLESNPYTRDLTLIEGELVDSDLNQLSIDLHLLQLADNMLDGYRNILIADGLIIISPELLEDIHYSLGSMNDTKRELMDDYYKTGHFYKRNGDVDLSPLKLSYFNMDTHTGNAVPHYIKSLSFVLYRRSLSDPNSRDFLSVVTEKYGVDGILFGKSVKTGNSPRFEIGSINKDNLPDMNDQQKLLTLVRLDPTRFIYQLPLTAHVSETRRLGVQVDKILISNLRNSNETFDINGEKLTGQQMFDLWVQIRKELVNRLSGRILRSVLDIDNVSRFTNLILSSLPQVNQLVEDHAATGTNINLVLDRLLSTFILRRSDELLYLNLPGTYLVQRPEMADELNLKFRNERGNMEVLIGVDMLKYLVPGFNDLSVEQINLMIQDNPELFVDLAYRIPTQGFGFTAKTELKMVLPSSYGMILVNPTGWTIPSGSDADGDKTYLLTHYYEFNDDGSVANVKLELNNLNNASDKSLLNTYMEFLKLVMSSENAKLQSTVLLDFIVQNLSDFARTYLGRNLTNFDRLGSPYSVTFKYQISQAGTSLGLFLLLSGLYNLLSNYDVTYKDRSPLLNMFDLLSISTEYANDGVLILDYLNAMISTFVDALKGDYLTLLNVNRNNLSLVEYLIMSGFGLNTFLLINQPSGIDAARRGVDKTLKSLYNRLKGKDLQQKFNQLRMYNPEVIESILNLNITNSLQNDQLNPDYTSNNYILRQALYAMLYDELNTAGKKTGSLIRTINVYNSNPFSSMLKLQLYLTSIDYNTRRNSDSFTNLLNVMDDVAVPEIVDLMKNLLNLLSLKFSGLTLLANDAFQTVRYYTFNESNPTTVVNAQNIALSAIRFYPTITFVQALMLESNQTIGDILKTPHLTNRITELKRTTSNQLIQLLNPSMDSGVYMLNIETLFLMDDTILNILYTDYKDLYNNPDTRQVLIDLYKYLVLTLSPIRNGIQLYNLAPVSMLVDLGAVDTYNKIIDSLNRQDLFKDALNQYVLPFVGKYLNPTETKEFNLDQSSFPNRLPIELTDRVVHVTNNQNIMKQYYKLSDGVYNLVNQLNYHNEYGDVNMLEGLNDYYDYNYNVNEGVRVNETIDAQTIQNAEESDEYALEITPTQQIIGKMRNILLNDLNLFVDYAITNNSTDSTIEGILGFWQESDPEFYDEFINNLLNCM